MGLSADVRLPDLQADDGHAPLSHVLGRAGSGAGCCVGASGTTDSANGDRWTGESAPLSLDIEALYVAHHRQIRGYIARRMLGHDDAAIQDMVADVFERAVRAAPSYRDRGHDPKVWLYQIAHNLIVDRRRRDGVVGFVRLGDWNPYGEHVGTDDHVARLDAQITVSKALETYQTGHPTIPPDLQLAVIREKYFVGGYDREIGERLGLTTMSVKKLRERALANLKKQVEVA